MTEAYHPILKAAVQYSMAENVGFWAAVDHFEKRRDTVGGFRKLLDGGHLPNLTGAAGKQYLSVLHDEAFCARSLQALEQTLAVPAKSDEAESASPPPPAVVAIDGATRYLGLDPSMSCGWAILQARVRLASRAVNLC